MATMKAAVLKGPQRIEIEEIPVPEMKPGYMEIDVRACGVCGSDVHMWKAGKGWSESPGPFVMGHEFCGTVSNPGESDFKVGERVTFWANRKVVMIGNSIDPKVPFSMNRAVLQEVQLLGSVSCTRVEFEETIRLIASGAFDPVKYVTDILPLDGLQRALERQINPYDPLLKTVIKM